MIDRGGNEKSAYYSNNNDSFAKNYIYYTL